MRIEPENGIISMMRGDTVVFPVRINEGSKLIPQYRELATNERLYFALMEPGQAFEDAVMKKVFDVSSPKDEDGHTIVRINSSDTENLLVGTYYYTVKLRTIESEEEDTVRTIIQPTLFCIYGNNPEFTKDYGNVILPGDNNNVDLIIFDGGDISENTDYTA